MSNPSRASSSPLPLIRSTNFINRSIDRLRLNSLNLNLNLIQKLSLSSLFALSLIQLIGIPTVLVRTRGQSCDQPLGIYLLLHTLRVAFALPCSFSLGFWSSSSSSSSDRVILKNLKWLQYVLSLWSFICFLIGNYFFFQSVSCKHTCRELYISSAIVLSLGYIYALEIILVILAVIFCLPVLIIGVAWFGWGEKKHEIGPLNQQSIDQIPLVVYLPMLTHQSGVAQKESVVEIEKQASSGTIELTAIDVRPHPSSDNTPFKKIDHKPLQTMINMTSECPTTFINPNQSTSNGETEQSPQEGLITETGPDSASIPVLPQAQAHVYHPQPSIPHPAPILSPTSKLGSTRKLWGLIRGSKVSSDETPSNINHAPWPIKRLDANHATCAICLSDYSSPDMDEWDVLRELRNCGHCFHKDCLDPWLRTSGRCPLCQLSVNI